MTPIEALKRLLNGFDDCIALRNWDIGFADWADVAELKDAFLVAKKVIADSDNRCDDPACPKNCTPEDTERCSSGRRVEKMNKHFSIGNVIRTYEGMLEIVTENHRDEGIGTIPIGDVNCFVFHKYETETYDDISEDSGETIIMVIHGANEATRVADTVKDYILHALLKNFEMK